MIEALQTLLGLGLVAVGWLMPRRLAGARIAIGATLALDAAPFAIGTALLAVATGRPVFVGLIMFALGGGLAVADRAMRETLREPVVFQAMSEFPQIFTHPHLYLPFAGPVLVLGGAAAALAAAEILLVFEPPVWTPAPLAALTVALAIVVLWWVIGHAPVLGKAASLARRLGPRGDPEADAAALGPFAMLLVHCTIARAERPLRQRALAVAAAKPAIVAGRGMRRAPIVLVQCESFFDARRLSPHVPKSLLPAFEECCRSGTMHGRLDVPGWGANTMRSEFAVLTGIPEAALGYDRFNPYYALARVPLRSHVWRLRQAGYRTVCLHPFSRRFFRRDIVMPALGFDRFLGRETIGGSRAPPYQQDPELARHVLRVLDAEGPQSFIFVITMANHGPWPEPVGPAAGNAAWLDPAGVPQGAELLRYLEGLRRSDEMLQILMRGLAERHPEAILAFYGDHQPSLPHAFAHFGFDEAQSDYAIWPGSESEPRRVDLAAHLLGGALVDLALGTAGQATAAIKVANR